MHREYLKEHNPIRFDDLCLTGELWTYLTDLYEQAQNRFELIIVKLISFNRCKKCIHQSKNRCNFCNCVIYYTYIMMTEVHVCTELLLKNY